jgi:hypothetical protein
MTIYLLFMYFIVKCKYQEAESQEGREAGLRRFTINEETRSLDCVPESPEEFQTYGRPDSKRLSIKRHGVKL